MLPSIFSVKAAVSAVKKPSPAEKGDRGGILETNEMSFGVLALAVDE